MPSFPLVALETLFVFLWGGGYIASKVALDFAGALDLMALRYALLAVLLIAWFAIARSFTWPGLRPTAHEATVGLLAHFGTIGAGLLAMDRGVAPGLVALLTALYPIATAILAGPLLGEHMPRRHGLGYGMAAAGVLLIAGSSLDISANPTGIVLAFVPPACLTAASLYERWLAQKGATGRLPVLYSLLVQAGATMLVVLALTIVLAPGIDFRADPAPSFALALLYLVIGSSLGSYALYWHLLRHRPAERVVSLTYFSAPVAMLLGWAIFGNRLDLLDGLGFAVAAFGIWLAQTGGTRSEA